MNTVTDHRSQFKRFLLVNSTKKPTQKEEKESNMISDAYKSPLISKQLDDGDQVIHRKVKSKLATELPKQQSATSLSVKDAAKSLEYLQKGEQACKEDRFEDASYLYTLAILNAPDAPLKGSSSFVENAADSAVSVLALAHEKRSAVFFQLHQWSDCLVDIDCAIEADDKYTGGRSLAYRALLIRKVECLIAVGQYSEARRLWATESVLTSIENPSGPEADRAQVERLKHLHFYFEENYGSTKKEEADFNPLLKTVTCLMNSGQYEPSAGAISLSAKVKPIYCGKENGSSAAVVATSHIGKGEVVSVEAPYLAALYEQYELLFCHFCCVNLESTHPKSGRLQVAGPVVPCTTCTQVLYCSSACRDISWSAFHRFECAILPKLHHLSSGAHLALRILLSTGLKTIDQAIKNEQEVSGLEPADLVSLYSQLYSAQSGMKLTDGLCSTADELMDLAKQCGFFTTTTTTKEVELASHVLLRHLLQLEVGSRVRRPVSVFMASPPYPSAVYREVAIAEALYPIGALFQQSDVEGDSNVQVNFVNGHQMIVSAAREIAFGEKLLMPAGLQQAVLNEQQ